MDEVDVDRIAARVVEKLMETMNVQILSRAIAMELRQFGIKFVSETARLGERLDSGRF